MYYYMVGNVLHATITIVYILQRKSSNAFDLGIYFQGCLSSKELWNLETVSSSEAKSRFTVFKILRQSWYVLTGKDPACLLLIITYLGSANSGTCIIMQLTLCIYAFILSHGNQDTGNWWGKKTKQNKNNTMLNLSYNY